MAGIFSKNKKVITVSFLVLIPYLILLGYNLGHSQRFFLPDSHLYEDLANNLLTGRGFTNEYGNPEFERTPGYPAFIAICYLLYHNPATVILIQIMLVVLTGLIIYRIIAELGYSNDSGLVAMILFCLSGVVLTYTMFLMSEILYTFFITFYSFYSISRIAYRNN